MQRYNQKSFSKISKKRLFLFCCIMILISIPCMVFAQHTASISGTVYESDGQTPLTDTDIQISAISGDPCGNNQWIEGGYIDETDGTFSIEGLPAGDYYLITDWIDGNYIEEWWSDKASSADCAQAALISVTPEAEIIEKDFQLDKSATISGTVYESDGITPLTGTEVHVWVISGDPCGNRQWIEDAYIDESTGTFTIDEIPEGAYYLKTDWIDGNYTKEWWSDKASSADCSQAALILVTPEAEIIEKDFQLDKGGTISGAVYESDGQTPLTGTSAWIEVRSGDPCGNNQWIESYYIDQTDGTFSIEGLPDGDFYLQTSIDGNYIREWWSSDASTQECSQAGLISIASEAQVTGKDFQLDVGGSISGTVTDEDNQPVSNLVLQIYDEACWDNYITSVVTASSGRYFADGLPGGDVYIRACTDCNHKPFQNIWWDGGNGASDAACSMAEPVQVNPGKENFGVDFKMTKGQRRVSWFEIANGNGRLGAGFGMYENFEKHLTGAKLIFPDNSEYIYNLADDYFDMKTECSGSDGWYHNFNDSIIYGEYTIQLTFTDGVTKTYTKEIRDVPLPPRIDSSTMTADVQKNGDIKFSWQAPAGSDYYYQVRIYDSIDKNKRYYRNDFIKDVNQFTVPAHQLNCLKKGEKYLMQVRIFDHPDWNLYQAMSSSNKILFTYTPGVQEFENRVKWFDVSDWRGSFSYGFSTRSGSMENITSAIVTRPDNATYIFDLTEDWYDNSSETYTGKGWWVYDGQAVEGKYTLEVIFDDGYSEIRSFDWALPAVTVTPVDSGTMNQQVFQDGSIDFSWDTTGLDPQLKHQIIVHSVDDTKRFYRSRSETDRQNITVYQYDLRGLEFGKTYIWYVRTYSPSYTTTKYSLPKQFVYNPFGLGDPVTSSFPIQGSVMNLRLPEGNFTYLDIYIGTGDFEGRLINCVESISITGPNNLSLTMDDLDYWFNSYFYGGGFNVDLENAPAQGEYTFSVNYLNGDNETSTDFQGEVKQIPFPTLTAPGSEEVVNTLFPKFSWEGVSMPDTPIYYRLQIQDAQRNTIFAGNRQEGMLEYKLDSGILEAGKKYFWRVRATDSGDFVNVNNRAQTDYRSFTISSDADVDADGDGVIDAEDQCPGTPVGTNVYENGCSIVKGDINLDKKVDLKDSMLGLKVMTGLNNSASNQADVDGDGKTGYEEAIYPLQIMSIDDVLSGIWKVYHSEGNEEEGPEYIEFIQSGNTISGSYMCNDPDAFVGTLKGDSVSLTFEEMDESFLLSGTINGDSITGTFSSTEGDEFGTWRAERTSESCPSPKSVPAATISVDGNTTDWAGINPVIIDPSGDGNSISGSDIGRIFLAQDSQNLYVRIDLENGSPLNDLYFGVAVRPNWKEFAGDRFVFINTSNASCSVESWSGTDHYHTKVADGNLAVSGSVIEGSVPISALDPSDKSFVSGWNDTNGPSIDDTNTVLVEFATESNPGTD